MVVPLWDSRKRAGSPLLGQPLDLLLVESLGNWSEYLAMPERILRINEENQFLLSNDLGAITGFLFDVGTGRYDSMLQATAPANSGACLADLARFRKSALESSGDVVEDSLNESHCDTPGVLRTC